jgi:hypothetical protein
MSFHEGMATNSMQSEQYPKLAVAGADWPFQGIDMAFFDTLMGTVGCQENETFGAI